MWSAKENGWMEPNWSLFLSFLSLHVPFPLSTLLTSQDTILATTLRQQISHHAEKLAQALGILFQVRVMYVCLRHFRSLSCDHNTKQVLLFCDKAKHYLISPPVFSLILILPDVSCCWRWRSCINVLRGKEESGLTDIGVFSLHLNAVLWDSQERDHFHTTNGATR